MYDGKKCSVFTRSGIHKFEGELGKDILEIGQGDKGVFRASATGQSHSQAQGHRQEKGGSSQYFFHIGSFQIRQEDSAAAFNIVFYII